MKKFRNLIVYLLTLALLSGFFVTPEIDAATNTVPTVSAHAYVIMDAHSGNILLSYNANKKIYPASTVKLMTALVTLDKLNTNRKITITNSMLSQVPADTAKLNLKSGSTYSVSSLLHMLLLPSAADAATSLAIGSYGSNQSFIKKMNEKAKKIGLSKTRFDNTIGVDIGNGYYNTYTTAKDFTVLARHAMSNTTIRNIVQKKSYVVPATKNAKKFTIKNTNLFYSSASYHSELYTIIGTKTGSTKAAGSVLIATAKDKNGHEVICAFFGNSTREKLYQDIDSLLQHIFEQNKNDAISLSKGFYDTWFLSSNKLICSYYNQNLISSSGGRFYPKRKVTQKNFIKTVNKIAKSDLKVRNTKKYIRVQDLAQIIYSAYPDSIPTKQKNKIAKTLKNTKNLSPALVERTCILYHNNLLPKNYSKNVNTYLTKEDMILVAKNISSWIKGK